MALVDRPPDYQAFIEATENGYVEEVKQYLKMHPEFLDLPCGFGWSPLHYAALYGRDLIVELFLHRGSTSLDSRCHGKKTPLHLAAARGRGSTVLLLLRHGSTSIGFRDDIGNTPLQWAVMNGNDSTVEVLARFSCSFSSDRLGWTYAASHGRNSTIELLLQSSHQRSSIVLDALDNDGATPLYWAVVKGHHSIVTILRVVGATVSSGKLNSKQIEMLHAPIPEEEILEFVIGSTFVSLFSHNFFSKKTSLSSRMFDSKNEIIITN